MTLPTDTRSGGFAQPYLPAPARRAADEVRAALLSTRQGAGMERGIDQGVTAGRDPHTIQPGPRLQGGSGGNRSIPNSPAGRAKMEGSPVSLQVGPTETSGIIGAQGECAAINHLRDLPHNAAEGEI